MVRHGYLCNNKEIFRTFHTTFAKPKGNNLLQPEPWENSA